MELGINLVGSDWDLYPSSEAIDYFAAKGFTSIRVGISWEKLQPIQDGPLDQEVVANLRASVEYAASQGIEVILDVHNYGYGYGHLIGTSGTPVSSFASLWAQIAGEFRDNGNVVFGLMNEPQQATATDWLPAVNAAIDAIRDAGASQRILVSGVHWDGAHSWTLTDNATVLGTPDAIIDPLNNFAFEVHQYLDDTSGQNAWVVSETIGVERLQAITAWARETGATLYLGEFGVADNPTAMRALDNMLKFLQSNDDVWSGVAYWAAGAAWNDYMYSVEPDLGMLDKSQMRVLEKYGAAHFVETALENGQTKIETFAGARSTASMVDVVSADGELMSRVIYDAEGHTQRALAVELNGNIRLEIYELFGSESPSTIEVYSADLTRLIATEFASDRSWTTEFFRDGSHNPWQVESYGAMGDLIYRQVNSEDGTHVFFNYRSGVLSSQDTFDAGWALTERISFNSAGEIAERHMVSDLGHHVIDRYDQAGIRIVSTDVYSTNWSMISHTTYDSQGRIQTIQSNLEGGGHKIETHEANGVYLSRTELFDANWHLTSRSVLALDGTRSTEYYSVLSQIVEREEVHDINGKLMSLTEFNEDGHRLSTTLSHDDGSSVVSIYDGTIYSRLVHVDALDSHGILTQRTHYDIGGSITSIDRVLDDGGHEVQHFTGGSHPEFTESYDPNWVLLERTRFDVDGNRLEVQENRQDGAHIISRYSPLSVHPDTVDAYDVNWNMISRSHLNSSGEVTSIDYVQADGTHRIDEFEIGTPHVTSSSYFDRGWNFLQRDTYTDAGVLVETHVQNADGSHTVLRYFADGSGLQYTDTFDANWTFLERVDQPSSCAAVDPSAFPQPLTASDTFEFIAAETAPVNMAQIDQPVSDAVVVAELASVEFVETGIIQVCLTSCYTEHSSFYLLS